MAERHRGTESYTKSPEDEYWSIRPVERVLIAITVSLICDSGLGIGPSQIVAAFPKSRNWDALRTVIGQRKKGKSFLQSFTRIEDLEDLAKNAPRMSPYAKHGQLARALIAVTESRDLAHQNEFLPLALARLKLVLQGELRVGGAQHHAPRVEISTESAAEALTQEPENSQVVTNHQERLNQARGAIRFLLNEIDIEPSLVRNAHLIFTGKSKNKTKSSYVYYKCYRFHSKIGFVVKSLMVIKPATDEVPITMFTNISKVGDYTRVSRGIVVPGGNQLLYFLGSIEDNGALKIMAMHIPPSKRDSYVGIGLSIDDDGQAIAARFILTQTNAENDVDAGVGEIDVETARAELGENNLKKIRNRVRFRSESDRPIKQGHRTISPQNLSFEVQMALRQDGEPAFKIGDEEFNPADERHYTYNSALTIWHEGEKD